MENELDRLIAEELSASTHTREEEERKKTEAGEEKTQTFLRSLSELWAHHRTVRFDGCSFYWDCPGAQGISLGIPRAVEMRDSEFLGNAVIRCLPEQIHFRVNDQYDPGDVWSLRRVKTLPLGAFPKLKGHPMFDEARKALGDFVQAGKVRLQQQMKDNIARLEVMIVALQKEEEVLPSPMELLAIRDRRRRKK